MFWETRFSDDISRWNLHKLKDFETMFTDSFYEIENLMRKIEIEEQIEQSQKQERQYGGDNIKIR